jgi:FMN phosphatase YigB (HAD superfamily)
VVGVVFDLDNTLLMTRMIPDSVVEPAVEAILRHRGREHVSKEWLLALKKALYTRAFDEAARDMDLTDAEARAGFTAFASVTLPPDLELALFPDAKAALDELQVVRQRGLRAALVTRGFARLQMSKVMKLGLQPLFDRFLIDAIDDPRSPRFPQIISTLVSEWGCSPARVVVIDDDVRKLEQAVRCGTLAVLVDRDFSEDVSEEGAWTRVPDLGVVMRALREA